MAEENKIADEIFSRVDAISTKLMELAPVAYNKLVFLKQAESFGYLAVGGICLLLSVLSYVFFTRKAIAYAIERAREYEVFPILAAMAMTVATIGFGGAALGNLLYIWNWIGAFAPEARLLNDMWSGLITAKS